MKKKPRKKWSDFSEERKEKERRYNKKWREKNKEKFNKYQKEYYQNNKGMHKKWHKKWRDKNREKFNKYQKEYYEINKEYWSTINSIYYWKNNFAKKISKILDSPKNIFKKINDISIVIKKVKNYLTKFESLKQRENQNVHKSYEEKYDM